MKNNFYVYGLYDPRTNQPFYIGKGKGARMFMHLREAKLPPENQTNKLKCAIINNIMQVGFKPIITKINLNLSEEEALNQEIILIKQIGRLIDGTGPLSNLTKGGETGSGHPEPIKCYSLDGSLINSFSSLTEAAYNVGIHKSTICAALNRRTRIAGGFRWAYEDELVRDLEPNKHVSPVTQYTIEGKKIRDFASVNDAANFVNITFTSIVDACQGNHFSSGGFRWTYKDHQLLDNKTDLYIYTHKLYQALDKETEQIIGTFNTIKEAIKALPTAYSTGIVDCCRGRKKTCGGYKWIAIFK